MKSNTHNKLFVDCGIDTSSHVSLRSGTFLCKECADLHKSLFGRRVSKIKAMGQGGWNGDDLKSLIPPAGGNREFREFQVASGLFYMDIKSKYAHPAVLY